MFVSYSVTAVLKFVVAHDQKFFSSDFLYFSRWATAWLFFFKTRCSRLLSHHNLVTAPVLVLVALINVRRSSSTHCIFSDPVKEHVPPFWLIRNEFPESVAQSKQSRGNFWDCARWGLMAQDVQPMRSTRCQKCEERASLFGLTNSPFLQNRWHRKAWVISWRAKSSVVQFSEQIYLTLQRSLIQGDVPQ